MENIAVFVQFSRKFILAKNLNVFVFVVFLPQKFFECVLSNFSGIFMLQVASLECMTNPVASPRNLRCRNINISDMSEENSKKLSFTLSWDFLMVENHTLPQCFDIFYHDACDQAYIDEKGGGRRKLDSVKENNVGIKYGKFIGRSYAHSYYIDNMMVLKECTTGIRITVQSVDYAGRRQIPDDNAFIEVVW